MTDIPELLTPREAAPLLRISYKTVLELIHAGKLKAIRYGTQQYRIRRDAIPECIFRLESEMAEKVVTKVVTEAPIEAVEFPEPRGKVSPAKRDRYETQEGKPCWWERLGGK